MCSCWWCGVKRQGIAFYTIFRYECLREWQINIVAPLMTLILYIVVFGPIIGDKVGPMGGVNYINYIFPGLVILAVVLNAYNSSALSLYLDKFLHCHEEWLTSSVSLVTVFAALGCGSVMRCLVLVLILSAIGASLGGFPLPEYPLLALAVIVLTAIIFSYAGLINALLAETFDQISMFPNLILVPLTFTGGVFYDIALLGSSMRTATLMNPIFYMVDGLRVAIDANNYLSVGVDFAVMGCVALCIMIVCWFMVKRGVGLRS